MAGPSPRAGARGRSTSTTAAAWPTGKNDGLQQAHNPTRKSDAYSACGGKGCTRCLPLGTRPRANCTSLFFVPLFLPPSFSSSLWQGRRDRGDGQLSARCARVPRYQGRGRPRGELSKNIIVKPILAANTCFFCSFFDTAILIFPPLYQKPSRCMPGTAHCLRARATTASRATRACATRKPPWSGCVLFKRLLPR